MLEPEKTNVTTEHEGVSNNFREFQTSGIQTSLLTYPEMQFLSSFVPQSRWCTIPVNAVWNLFLKYLNLNLCLRLRFQYLKHCHSAFASSVGARN
jgi:hypothetical protein